MWKEGRQFVDKRISETLADVLDGCSANHPGDTVACWQRYLLSGDLPGPEALITNELITGIETILPELQKQLQQRVRPLRDAWESRGPGMLRRIEVTNQRPVTVTLLQPFVGGYGLVVGDQCFMEAMLVNGLDQLPEVIRLVWLVTTASRPDVHPLAQIPTAIEAAAAVDLAIDDSDTIELALQHWTNRPRDEMPLDLATALWQWWHNEPTQPPPC